MRIAIGSLQCEGNSLTPVLTRKADFDLAYGPDMLAKLQIAELLEEIARENCANKSED